jgi:hypothetical protein
VLDLAMIVLSRSKKAAVRALATSASGASGDVCCGSAESGAVTNPA